MIDPEVHLYGEIDGLKEENEKLRTALEKIADMKNHLISIGAFNGNILMIETAANSAWNLQGIARKALEVKG